MRASMPGETPGDVEDALSVGWGEAVGRASCCVSPAAILRARPSTPPLRCEARAISACSGGSSASTCDGSRKATVTRCASSARARSAGARTTASGRMARVAPCVSV